MCRVNPHEFYGCSQQQVMIQLETQKILKNRNKGKIRNRKIISLPHKSSWLCTSKGQDPCFVKNKIDKTSSCRALRQNKNNASVFAPNQPNKLEHLLVKSTCAVHRKGFNKKNIIENTKMKRRIVKYLKENSEYQWKMSPEVEQSTWEEFEPEWMSSNPEREEGGRGSFLALKRNRRFLRKLYCRIVDVGLLEDKDCFLENY